ncbi:MAG TPA: hypothetical protein VKI65_08910 [Gemmataceae bacterium]|nr:hypothetical protein [Gemmataceae bacterium]
MGKSRWLMVLLGLIVVTGLPFLGNWLRHTPPDACAQDGTTIDPLFRVRIVDDHGGSYAFCCINCARIWVRQHTQSARAVFVTDELSGKELESAAAHYVRSTVMTQPTTRNNIHVFASRADAERHAGHAGGAVLFGDERPFHALE